MAAPLWRVRAGEAALDAALAARGYARRDPTRLWWAEAEHLAPDRPERLTGFAIWPSIAILRDLWAAGGIGPARLAVMARAGNPKTAILARALGVAAGGGMPEGGAAGRRSADAPDAGRMGADGGEAGRSTEGREAGGLSVGGAGDTAPDEAQPQGTPAGGLPGGPSGGPGPTSRP